jgi:hypothetical protein
MVSKSPPPLMHINPIPESNAWEVYRGLVVGVASTCASTVSEGDVSCSVSRPSSLRGNEMYALTKPEGLNFGRQTGIHDADAGELRIDGAWIVFNRMWMSTFLRFSSS